MHYLQTECAQKLRNAQNPKIIKGIRYYGTCRPQVSGVQADLKGLYTCVMVLICQWCSALSLILTSLDVWFTKLSSRKYMLSTRFDCGIIQFCGGQFFVDYQFLKGLVFSCRTEAPHEIQVDRPWSFRFNHIKTCIFIAHKKLRAIQLFILMDL